MIEFNGNYFAAPEVESIAKYKSGNTEYPFGLRVTFKSGRSLGVDYQSETQRNRDATILQGKVNSELNSVYERIWNRLCLIEDAVRRIDKRQLRIWRQLKALLNIPGSSEDDV